jgi:hypothetical protein
MLMVAGILVIAAVITLIALARAKDGYEDAAGFHYGVRGKPPVSAISFATSQATPLKAPDVLPPPVPAATRHPVPPGEIAAWVAAR